jgi:hypothetical protein
MGRFPSGIPVIDRHGDRLSVYEIEIEDRTPILGIRRTLVRYELDSGEQVQFVDDQTFKVLSTGEELLRCVE